MKIKGDKKLSQRLESIGIALLVALFVDFYFSLSHGFFVPVATLFVMLAPVGSVVFQGVIRTAIMMVIIIIWSFLLFPHHFMKDRVCDIFIGGMIGIVSNLFIFPRRADEEFRLLLLPILLAYEKYFSAIVEFLFEKKAENAEKQKINLEQQLECLPDWVYDVGFDIGLKKGHQYFLMKIHQVAEILFAMHHTIRIEFDKEVIDTVRASVEDCAAKVKQLFDALITVFKLQKLTEGVEDFATELTQLDEKFQTLLPSSLSVVDMPTEDEKFYEFIYTLADLRKALIKLGQALR